MHDIIEHYGKVVIALAGVLAAVLLTAAVVTIVSDRTKGAVSDISYKEHIYDAIDAKDIRKQCFMREILHIKLR